MGCLLVLLVLGNNHNAWAHNVGQAQTSKFFDPDTVQMLKDRASGAAAGGPGLRQGDIISYIVESVPAPNGATLGAAGYITDYIPPGVEVVGAHFVQKVPDPTKYNGWAYIDGSMPYPGILSDGWGQNGGLKQNYLPPFGQGNLANGVQDTGVFFSTDPRTARIAIPYDITICTKAALAGTQLSFLVYNQWDFDQFVAFGDKNNTCISPLYPSPKLIVGGTGRGNPPVLDLSGVGIGPWVGFASPIAGPGTFYSNDFNPAGDLNIALNSVADFYTQGPWQRVQHTGALIGGSGVVTPAIARGVDTIAGVPATGGWALSTANPLPRTTNVIRFAIGERVVGGLEHVRVKVRIYNLAAFGGGSPAGCIPTTMPGGNCAIDPYTNLSSVFGADASGGAQGGKDHAYAYLGPSQANNNAQLVTTKAVVAISRGTVAGPWIASDGAFLQMGDFVKYRLTYLNAASATLTNVAISDIIDLGSATYANSASTGNPFLGIPTVLLNKVTWPMIPVLAPGGGGNVELVVQITGAGVGGISSNQIFGTAIAPNGMTVVDSYAAAVSTIVGVGVGLPPLITHSKTATPTAVANGQAIHYTITLDNPGGAISAPAQGNNKIKNGLIYPATASPTAGLIVGDSFPKTLLANDVTFTPATTIMTLTDTTTGIVYPMLAGANFTEDTITRLGDAFWDIITFPALHPRAGLAFDFLNSSVQIDFYATATTLIPGVYYNDIEAYLGDSFSGKDVTKMAINQAPVTIGAAPSFAAASKIAVDVNRGLLLPGDDVRYDFTLTNAGQAATTTLTMTDPIPTGSNFVIGSVVAPTAMVTYLDAYSAPYTPMGLVGAVDPYVRSVKLAYGVIGVGASVTPSLSVRLPTPNVDGLQLLNQANIDVYAGVTFLQFFTDDPNQAGTQDPTLIFVTAKPDYSTSSKTVLVNGAASTQTSPGDALTYTINLLDSGTSSNSATNVRVQDTIDLTKLENIALGVTPAGWGVVGPDPYTGLVTWTTAVLPHGSSATFSFTADVKLNVTNGSTVNNAAVMSSDQTSNVTINALTLTVPTTTVMGTLFNDANSNGTQQAGEGGLQNVTVALRVPGFGSDIIVASTDANGNYALISPIAGDWYVQVTDDFGVITGRTLTTANNPLAVNLANGTTTTGQNFGYAPLPTPAVINGTVFNDTNGNGIKNVGDGGHSGVSITLKNAANVILSTTSTNASGGYAFSGLTPGNYTLDVTDTGGVLVNDYLTTLTVSPYSVVALALLETRTVDFGYRLGSRVGDLVFNDLDSSGTWTLGDSAVAGIAMELRPVGGMAGTALQVTTTDTNGVYTFQGVAPGSYDVYADAGGVLSAFTATTAVVSPYTTTVVSGVDNYTTDFGYVSLPAINVTKSTSTGVVGFNAAVHYTITVNNTGGAAVNFLVRDILPTTTPALTVPPYTMSTSGFLYLSTDSVTLNGAPFIIPVQPVLYGTQPTWSGFTLPAASNLVIQFSAFSGSNEGLNYNGVHTEYNNTAIPPATQQEFPNLATVLVSDVGKVTKRVAAVNGVLWSGTGVPTVAGNDVINYEVQMTNTPAALAHTVSIMRDYLPTGFTYKANSAFVTDTVSYPLGVAVLGAQVGNTVTFTMPVLNPSTGAAYPGSITLNFDAYAATGSTGTFTNNASMLVSVNALLPIDVYSGDTAAVSLAQHRIGDTVFFDNNADGVLNVGDTYAAYVTMELRPVGGGVGSAIATATTDVLGQYGFLINTAGTYDVVVTDTAGILLGHASSTGGKTQTAMVSALNTRDLARDFGYIPPALSAVIEGTVFDDSNNNTSKDVSEAGIPAVTLGLYNLFGTLINTYSTPVGGTFRFAGIAGGLYQINVITPPAGYGGTSIAIPLSINVPDGTTSTGHDIGYIPFGSLAGTVFSDTSGDGVKQVAETTGFAGVVVQRHNAAMTLIDSYTTDANGDYLFSKISAGDYYVQVNGLSAPANHSGTTSQPLALTVVNAVVNSGNHMGYQPNGNVAGTVFLDSNANGVKNAGETTTFGGMMIDRYTLAMSYIDSYTTDMNGQFQFNLLPAGDYYVQVRLDPTGYGATTTQPRKVTAINATTSIGNDLGYQTFGSVAGRVFNDVDGSATYNAGDALFAAVTVDRYTTGGLFIDSYTTDGSGGFQFSQIAAGNYHLYAYPPVLHGATTTIPLSVTANNGIVSAGSDLGFRIYGSIAGAVFSDANGNAVLDGGETGVSAIIIDRYSGGLFIDSYTADANGLFQFLQVPAASYDLYAHLPTGYGATTGQPLNVVTSLGVVNGGNIGFQQAATINGQVFADVNTNGVFDTGDAWLPSATVNLKIGGTVMDTYTTTANGAYEFTGLLVGTNPSITYTIDVDQTLTPINNAALTTANDPASVLVTVGSTNTVASVGYGIQGSIAGRVYEEKDGVAGYNAVGDATLAGQTVQLYIGALLQQTSTSDATGAYSFGGLTAASYRVLVVTPASYQGQLPAVIPPATDPYINVVLASGGMFTGQDFGFLLPPNLTVVKTSNVPFAARQSTFMYNIQVSNSGGLATYVSVTDYLPIVAPSAAWLGVSAPSLSPAALIFPAAALPTATTIKKNGVLIATLPLAPYTQIAGVGTVQWSTATGGFTLATGDTLDITFAVDTTKIEGTYFNSLAVDYYSGVTPVTMWHADAQAQTVTRTYTLTKAVKAVNGIAVVGTPTINVGDVITWQLTLTNLRGKGKINKDEIAAVSLVETLPLGFKYVPGSTKVVSPGNGVLILTPLLIDGVVLPAASALVKEVVTYTFGAAAVPVVGDSWITGSNLNDTATLQFDAYAYDAVTPNSPLAGTHNNQATSLADRLGKAGIFQTFIGAPVIVSSKARVQGTIFQDLVVDGLYNALNDSTFNGVTVELRQGATVVDSYTTGINGKYDLLAPAGGAYSVVVTDLSSVLTGFNNTVASVMPITVVSGSLTTGKNYGYVLAGAAAAVNGTVFADTSLDGVMNVGELGIAGVIVRLKNSSGVTLASTTTLAGGTFSFTGLAAANVVVDVDQSSAAIAAYYNTPTAAPSDPYSITIAAGSISTMQSGWALGSIFSGTVFDDYSNLGVKDVGEPGHGNVTLQLVNTTTGLVVDNYTTQSSPISSLGHYQFHAVPPASYRIDVTDLYSAMVSYTLSTPNQPMVPVITLAGTNYLNHFGYTLPPNISVSKTMTSYTLDRGEKMNTTLTVTNTGGGVSAFSIADVLPSAAPVSPFIGGAGVFTASAVAYVFDATVNVTLNGVLLVPTVDYALPVLASATPTWGNIALPGFSTLVINFTAIQPGAAGKSGSPNYNGVVTQHSTLPAVVTDYPDLVIFATFKDATHSKIISHINGIAAPANPTIYRGDRVTFQLRVSNTIRAKAMSASQFTDALPKLTTDSYGFYYAAGSSKLTNPLAGGIATPILDPLMLAGPGLSTYQTLTWNVAAGTNAVYPSEVVLQFDAYADARMSAGSYINHSTATAAKGGGGGAGTILYASYPMTVAASSPTLTVLKSSNIALAKPGQVITYTIQVINSGTGLAHNVVIDDHMSPYTSFQVNFGTGLPFSMTNGVPASGLTLGVPVYSNNDAVSYVYAPAATGYDGNITNWQIPMSGLMNGNGSNFTIQYKAIVE